MAGIEERTSIGPRLLLSVLLASIVCPLLLGVIGIVGGSVRSGTWPQAAEFGGLAFLMVMGTMVSVMLWPVTLPGALMAWVAGWHLAWRAGWSEQGRAIVAGAVAGMGATAGLAVWGWWLYRADMLDEGIGLIGAVALSGGVAVAALVYHPRWGRDEGMTA